MNLPTANRNPGQTNMLAVSFGMLAALYSLMVLYPLPAHIGFTGTPPLIAFEVIKTAALFLILGSVYLRNRKEDDRAIRSGNTHKLQWRQV